MNGVIKAVADYAMLSSTFGISALFKLMHTVFDVFIDVMTFFGLCLRPPATLAAEILFLRQQLGLYVDGRRSHGGRPISIRCILTPKWRKDGMELYFVGADGNLMAGAVQT